MILVLTRGWRHSSAPSSCWRSRGDGGEPRTHRARMPVLWTGHAITPNLDFVPPAAMATLRRVLGLGSTGLFASQLAVHAMPLDSSWSRSRSALAQAQPDSRPVVVCGPSGVGKGTLLNRLMAEHPEDFGFSVSHTTRQPRAGEVDGVHYHFVKKEDMEEAITRGEFIEYARVHSNMYGTSVKGVEDVRAAGKTCLLDIDVQARAPCAHA